jgi:hypothetical protein
MASTTIASTNLKMVSTESADENAPAAGKVEEIEDEVVEVTHGDNDDDIEKLISEAGGIRDYEEEEVDQADYDEVESYQVEKGSQSPPIASPKRGLEEVGAAGSPKRRRSSRLQARQSLETSLSVDLDTPTKDRSQGRLESPIESPYPSPAAVRSSQHVTAARAPVQAKAKRQNSTASQRRGALTTASVFPTLANARRRKVILPIFTHSDSEESDGGGGDGAEDDSDADYVEGGSSQRSRDTFNLTIYKVPPEHGGTLTVNVVDVVHQVIVNHLSRFLKHDKRMRKARPAVRRAFARYRSLVHDHLLQLGDLVDSNAVLVARVRAATAQRDVARSRLLQLRDERMRVQRRMEQVRANHVEQTAKLNEAREVDFFLADLEQSRSRASALTENNNEDYDVNSGKGVGTKALNKVLLELDLLRPKLGKSGAAQILQKAVQKLEHLDQNLSF